MRTINEQIKDIANGTKTVKQILKEGVHDYGIKFFDPWVAGCSKKETAAYNKLLYAWKKQEIEKNIKKQIVRGIKTIKLENGKALQFYYNNNAGICTVILTSAPRENYSREQKDVQKKIFINNYKGFVRLSKNNLATLEL